MNIMNNFSINTIDLIIVIIYIIFIIRVFCNIKYKGKFMEEFISKEFECRNRYASDNKIINSIVDFLRTIEDKIEIENKNGKRVNAKSFVKMMGLDIEYGYKFTLYVYGNDRENNLKRIEELLD